MSAAWKVSPAPRVSITFSGLTAGTRIPSFDEAFVQHAAPISPQEQTISPLKKFAIHNSCENDSSHDIDVAQATKTPVSGTQYYH